MKKYLKENYKSIILKVSIILLVLAIDLITKIVFANIFESRYDSGNFDNIIVLKNILSFTYTENIGAAFSIFSGEVAFLIIFSIIFIGVFIYLDVTFKEKSAWMVAGFSLIIGGAIGNLIDRIFLGYVRDFISFDILKDFAICNFADVCITIGCVCYAIFLIIYLVKNFRNKSNNAKEEK